MLRAGEVCLIFVTLEPPVLHSGLASCSCDFCFCQTETWFSSWHYVKSTPGTDRTKYHLKYNTPWIPKVPETKYRLIYLFSLKPLSLENTEQCVACGESLGWKSTFPAALFPGLYLSPV